MKKKTVKKILKITFVSYFFLRLIFSCTLSILESREYYDPYFLDEEECAELIRINSSLDAFFDTYSCDELLNHFIMENYIPDAKLTVIDNIKRCARATERYSKRGYNARSFSIPYKKAISWKMIIKKHKRWYKQLREELECYLYRKSQKSKFPFFPRKLEHENYDDYFNLEKELKEKSYAYYSIYNPSRIGYSELINDDYGNYQIWAICKETDTECENPVFIKICYDEDNKRKELSIIHCKEEQQFLYLKAMKLLN